MIAPRMCGSACEAATSANAFGTGSGAPRRSCRDASGADPASALAEFCERAATLATMRDHQALCAVTLFSPPAMRQRHVLS